MSSEPQSYICNKCNHPPFRTQKDLDDHISHMCENLFFESMSSEPQSYICNKCYHPPFRTQKDLDDHISHMCENLFFESKPYECSKCHSRFFTQDELNKHIQLMITAIDWIHNE